SKNELFQFSSYNYLISGISILCSFFLLMATRGIALNSSLEKERFLAIDLYKWIVNEIVNFSLCFITCSFLLKIYGEMIFFLNPLIMKFIFSAILFFYCKMEKEIWKRITIKQDYFLYFKYQKNFLSGVILF